MAVKLSNFLSTTYTGPQGPQGPQGSTGPQGPSSMSDGTATAPGLPFAANTATGFYRPAANTIAISTAGSERMRIDSTGRMNVASMTISANVDNSSTGYFALPVGTTAQRPSSAANGMIRFNSTDNNFEYYDGTRWRQPADAPYNIEYLVVAGGASGGEGHGGGGGAGGYLDSTLYVAPLTAYTVTIGAGGAQKATGANANGNSGNNSVFASATATAGGYGGGYSQGGGSGGSGGGAGGYGNPGGSGTSGQGNSGGNSSGVVNGTGGGGGGATAAGNVGTTGSPYGQGGAGGAGINWKSLGTFYAGGGGAGSDNARAGGLGGSSIGGQGAGNQGDATAGTVNRGAGGGGGGAGGSGSFRYGAAGGSGIVIIRYLGAQRGTGGTVTSSGGYTIHTFTTSGTYTA